MPIRNSPATTFFEGGTFQHGTESSRLYQAPDSRRQGNPGSPGRSGSRPARSKHHGFHQGINERTKNDAGMIIPVIITVYADRSFSFVTKTPPAPVLIKKACGIESGSAVPNKTKVAKLSKADCQKIAETKMPDLNAASLEAAMSMIAAPPVRWVSPSRSNLRFLFVVRSCGYLPHTWEGYSSSRLTT